MVGPPVRRPPERGRQLPWVTVTPPKLPRAPTPGGQVCLEGSLLQAADTKSPGRRVREGLGKQPGASAFSLRAVLVTRIPELVCAPSLEWERLRKTGAA